MPAIELFTAELITPQSLSIIAAAPRPGLGADPKCETTRRAIEALVDSNILISSTSGDAQSEALCRSALWLLAGELDRSHTLSQSIETPDGSYWHGIMHRREGDFWNSKYWFRRVGRHPVLGQLAERIAAERTQFEERGMACRGLVDRNTVAEAIVDLCQAAMSEKPELSLDLELICWWEWQLLFRYSLG